MLVVAQPLLDPLGLGDVAVEPGAAVQLVVRPPERRRPSVEDRTVGEDELVASRLVVAGGEVADHLEEDVRIGQLQHHPAIHLGVVVENLARNVPDFREARVRIEDSGVGRDDDDAVEGRFVLRLEDRVLQRDPALELVAFDELPDLRADRRDHLGHGRIRIGQRVAEELHDTERLAADDDRETERTVQLGLLRGWRARKVEVAHDIADRHRLAAAPYPPRKPLAGGEDAVAARSLEGSELFVRPAPQLGAAQASGAHRPQDADLPSERRADCFEDPRDGVVERPRVGEDERCSVLDLTSPVGGVHPHDLRLSRSYEVKQQVSTLRSEWRARRRSSRTARSRPATAASAR